MADTANDPVVKNYREQISDNDVKILEALNKRVKLVKSLKDYKDAHGLSFYDPALKRGAARGLPADPAGGQARSGGAE